MNNTMTYKGYHAKIEFDSEDCIFVGKVSGLSDSLNFHGTSVEELKQMFHQSVDNYLELCKEIGKSPDKEYSGSFNVRIPSDLHRQAAEAALLKGETINSIMKDALTMYLVRDNEKYFETSFMFAYNTETNEKYRYDPKQYTAGKSTNWEAYSSCVH